MGEKYDLDWRLLSAIARHESFFKPDVCSQSGALGLMQVMPAVAALFSVSAGELLDPYKNAEVASRLLIVCKKQLATLDIALAEDFTHFLVACYHCGFSRVERAVEYAKYYNEKLFTWEHVSFYLELLGEHNLRIEQEEDDPAQVSYSAGNLTNIYVERVLDTYKQYCRLYPGNLK